MAKHSFDMELHNIGLGIFIVVLMGGTIGCENEPQQSVHQACVSAATPEAAQAGYEILAAGGNAADAAVAVAFALGVSEPAMSGLGGGMQVLYAPAGEPPVSVNGTTWSPAATPIFLDDTLTYHRRSTVPSTVKTLGLIHQQYGSGMQWEQLLAPAIRLAEQGFVVGPFRHRVYKRTERQLQRSPYLHGTLLLDDGTIPAIGDTIRQITLASTLRRLARNPDDFYTGEIAQVIARDMQQHGGWISAGDLAGFPEPEVRPALHASRSAWDVYTAPPPSGGWTALLILNLLEHDQTAANEPRELVLARVLNIAHGIRRNVPEIRYDNALLAQALTAEFADLLLDSLLTPARLDPEGGVNGETTHYSIVDSEGNAISVTASINAYFGAAAMSRELGFLYNSYMDDFVFNDTAHVDGIRPHSAAYSSMSPTIVQRRGQTQLVLGSPGSARIISTVAQLTDYWIEHQPSPAELLMLPRVHALSGRVYLERSELSPRLFRDAGFTIAHPTYDLIQQDRNAYFGGVHAIARAGNGWTGAADPRRDGAVLYVD